jgi:Fuc2NAc and GlcNAc transferase
MIYLLPPILLCLSWALTRQFVVHARKLATIDIPNERSSHSAPTPRGGGIAFVLTSVLAFITIAILTSQFGFELLGLSVAGGLVATVGQLDDRKRISGATVRLFAHSIAATILVVAIGLPDSISFFNQSIEAGLVTHLVIGIALVWLLNLFNFMDGTDGIAASEAAYVALTGALLTLVVTSTSDHSAAGFALAASVLGFLVYNWSPAKIFMGDVGSGFLGITIGGLALLSTQQNAELLWVWIILLGVFVTDATITLLRRLARKQKPHVAHRSHAYQHLALRYQSHSKVAIGMLAINVLWLLPIAYLVADGRVVGTTGVLIAYVPLVIAAVLLGSGKD